MIVLTVYWVSNYLNLWQSGMISSRTRLNMFGIIKIWSLKLKVRQVLRKSIL